jgi:ATP-dependent protease ClpP protease subunit
MLTRYIKGGNKRKLEDIPKPIKKIKFGNLSNNDEEVPIVNPFNFLSQRGDLIYRHANHIYFRDEVNYETINRLGKLINEINGEYKSLSVALSDISTMQPKPIYLHITSHGGLLFAGFMGCDMIMNSAIPIYTIVEGNVASAGTLMSIVGKKRYMTENAFLLIHQLSSMEMGNFEQLKDEHENNTQLMKRVKSMYLKYTNLTVKQLKKILKHDIYWNYDTAKKYGLVDELYRCQ